MIIGRFLAHSGPLLTFTVFLSTTPNVCTYFCQVATISDL